MNDKERSLIVYGYPVKNRRLYKDKEDYTETTNKKYQKIPAQSNTLFSILENVLHYIKQTFLDESTATHKEQFEFSK